MLTQTDMMLRPEFAKIKAQTEVKIAPYKKMSTSLGSRQQQKDFENLMEIELDSLVRSKDCLKGIEILVETLKKQHVSNFAMQQQYMAAINKKTEIEAWK